MLRQDDDSCVFSDEVGQTLIQLQDQLEESELWNNQKVREAVLSLAIPKPLLKELGLKSRSYSVTL